jgi:hypothetical protein
MESRVSRHEFLVGLAVAIEGLALGATVKSHGQIFGSNDRLNIAVIGLHGRGYAHLAALKANRGTARILHVCVVDGNLLNKFRDALGEKLYVPISVGDIAVTMLQLSSIACEVNRELHLDTRAGKIQGDREAMKMWDREYEKGGTACLSSSGSRGQRCR